MTTVRFRSAGRTFTARGKALESIVRTRFGRTAVPRAHGGHHNRGPIWGAVTRTDKYGTHVLGTILDVTC